ncbi:MAG: hypothetical protein MPJ50_07960 [Pirellulales bacterium]|nr:hypothetical protein [Pirellulales bacterium]
MTESLTVGRKITLGDLAHTRSGDKGNHANLGVIAYSSAAYEHLKLHLTAQRVEEFFAPLFESEITSSVDREQRVERFELPGIQALNFLLYDVLAGGASKSLRLDTQAKLFSTAALEITLPALG